MNLRRPVWHLGALGANNGPLVGTTREVLAQVLDERDPSGRAKPV